MHVVGCIDQMSENVLHSNMTTSIPGIVYRTRKVIMVNVEDSATSIWEYTQVEQANTNLGYAEYRSVGQFPSQ